MSSESTAKCYKCHKPTLKVVTPKRFECTVCGARHALIPPEASDIRWLKERGKWVAD